MSCFTYLLVKLRKVFKYITGIIVFVFVLISNSNVLKKLSERISSCHYLNGCIVVARCVLRGVQSSGKSRPPAQK